MRYLAYPGGGAGAGMDRYPAAGKAAPQGIEVRGACDAGQGIADVRPENRRRTGFCALGVGRSFACALPRVEAFRWDLPTSPNPHSNSYIVGYIDVLLFRDQRGCGVGRNGGAGHASSIAADSP